VPGRVVVRVGDSCVGSSVVTPIRRTSLGAVAKEVTVAS